MPPDVPEPSATHQAISLATHRMASVPTRDAGRRARRRCGRSPTPSAVGTNEADRDEPDRTDDGMPELADRQAAEPVLDEEQALGDDDGEQPAGQAEQPRTAGRLPSPAK